MSEPYRMKTLLAVTKLTRSKLDTWLFKELITPAVPAITFTPGNGVLPSPSVTVPEIVVCAEAVMPIKKKAMNRHSGLKSNLLSNVFFMCDSL